MRGKRAVGGQLPDVAGAVPVADRRGLAGVEERAGGGRRGADYAQDERVRDVAGAVGRGERADEYGAAESGGVQLCGEFVDLNRNEKSRTGKLGKAVE